MCSARVVELVDTQVLEACALTEMIAHHAHQALSRLGRYLLAFPVYRKMGVSLGGFHIGLKHRQNSGQYLVLDAFDVPTAFADVSLDPAENGCHNVGRDEDLEIAKVEQLFEVKRVEPLNHDYLGSSRNAVGSV